MYPFQIDQNANTPAQLLPSSLTPATRTSNSIRRCLYGYLSAAVPAGMPEWNASPVQLSSVQFGSGPFSPIQGFPTPIPIPAGCLVFIGNRHATAAYFISANVRRVGSSRKAPGATKKPPKSPRNWQDTRSFRGSRYKL